MPPIRRFRTASLGVRLVVLVLVSLVSFVVARALIGVEVRDDRVPVAKGDALDGSMDVYVVPAIPDDARLRLYFDDDTREDGFARLAGGALEITTIDAGIEPLLDYLRRQGIVGYEVPIESSCEIMAPDHELFGALCMAYARSRMPETHPDIDGLPCSTCHATADLEASYERARNLVPTSATPPAGHRDVGDTPCATCHAGFVAGGAPASTPPPGHREIGSQACSSCHGSSGGDPGAGPVPLPPGHRDIGSQACSTCHGSGGDGDDDEHEEEDEHADDEDEDDDD